MIIKENWQEQFRALVFGWDSYKAVPITEEAIAAVENISVTPRNCGGIQIEKHADGIDFEMEIGADGRIESFLLSPSR